MENRDKKNTNNVNEGKGDGRKLSKAERARKADYEALKERLESQGYRETKLTMSALYANVMAIVVTLPIVIPLLVVFFAYNRELSFGDNILGSYFLWLISFIVAVVIHEVIHGITWAIFAEDHFKAISFGFIVEYLTPYCNCKDVLKKYQIVIGALMPTLLLGILPAVVGILIGSGFWFALGAIMIIGGGGDILCVCKVLIYRSEMQEKMYIDHPYEIGTVVFER